MTLNNLVNGKKLPILFVGSGFSKRYLNTPDWEGLLVELFEMMGKSSHDYKIFKSRIKTHPENRNISTGEIYAKIASELEIIFNNYFYESEMNEEQIEWIDRGLNPFKASIAQIISTYTIISEKEEEITAFKNLKDKIISLITTNYDVLVEQLFEQHKESVFIGQSQLFNPNSIELGELYKIHGCITESNNIVITSEDYEAFKNNAKLFSAKLLTLISENPVIFIGYSMSDPDIQHILMDLVSCLTKEQIESLKDHFYLVEYSKDESDIVEKVYWFNAKSYSGEETTFPISILSTDNYLKLYNELANLTPSMNLNTVKQVKRIVKDIVIESTLANTANEKVMTFLLEDINDLSNVGPSQKFAIAVGNIKEINNYGYKIRPMQEIFEDVLFNDKGINNEKILRDTYEEHYLKSQSILPIYKYVNGLTEEQLNCCPKVIEFIEKHNTVEDYLNGAIVKSLKHIPKGNTIAEVPYEWKSSTRRMYLWIIKNFSNLELEDVEKFLKEEMPKFNTYTPDSQGLFKRLISIYDLYKYKK
ncbi:SIR2 family protein [Gottfriedia luciferensis]|uniref:SIR2 family protein n=1 Tax=Gottfriedia luciferensis TaxID=178774 RepID=UPI000B4514D8|nr:SIR2 family protein [Gottfriedia luciferensis]